mmetsp:Transcript_14592/g.43574  ORF Transcript_14592/g.43574 Transcript_14592/m.43574 type:complete len:199 (-) Transcript_14592:40-636(-)
MFWSARCTAEAPCYVSIPEGQELVLSHAAVVSGKKEIVLSMEAQESNVVLATLFPKAAGGTQCTFTLAVPAAADDSERVIFRVTSGAVDLCGNLEPAEAPPDALGAVAEEDDSDDSDGAGYDEVWSGFGMGDYFDSDDSDDDDDEVIAEGIRGESFDLDDAEESEDEPPPAPKRKALPAASDSSSKKKKKRKKKKSGD